MPITQENDMPTLRFPEFSGNWTHDRLGKFISRVGQPVDVDLNEVYREIGIRSHGKGLFHKLEVKGKSLGNKRVFKVHVPAIVLNIVFAWEHAIALTSDKEDGFIASHRFPMYVPLNNKCELTFVLYFFLRKYGKYLLEIASPGGAGRNKTLGQKEFLKLKVTFPKLNEQKKISLFLSSIDLKIKQLSEKKILLEKYKNIIMEKLFIQDMRFKDKKGNFYPDWEVDILKNVVVSIKNGTANNQSSKGDIPVTRIETISSGIIDLNKVGYVRYTPDVDIYKMDKGDILFSNINSLKQIGKVAIYNIDETLYHGMNLLNIRVNKEKLLADYLYYFFQRNWSKKYFKRVCNRAINQVSINQTDLGKFPVLIPTLLEQQKITGLISSIDKKIELVTNELTQAKTFKKGLLQQMFI
jgi:type I restriction enzyme, S subunit